MKFIHCADLHLDSPLRGLTRYQGAPVDEMREATRRAFERLIALALQVPVEFVVIAGDLFDGDWPDFNTGLFFVGQMVRLNEAGIKVFMVRGNHDAESRITRDLPLPPNVIVLPTTRPHTLIDEDLRKQVARTKEQLYQAISEALKIITIHDVHAYFKHCGLCVLNKRWISCSTTQRKSTRSVRR